MINNKRKKTQALVVMNESHSLLPEQEKILEREYEGFNILSVPAQGWNIDEMLDQINKLHEKACGEKLDIVFVSPIPLMIRELTEMAMCPNSGRRRYRIKLFHNDRREKKELPGGKIIQVVAQTGWELV